MTAALRLPQGGRGVLLLWDGAVLEITLRSKVATAGDVLDRDPPSGKAAVNAVR
jgi:hypothetical protein